MISSDGIRGYTDLIVLSLLREQPDYGYSLSKRIRSVSDEKYTIKETTLYSTFTRLERNKFIVAFEGTATEGAKRTYYRITEKGQAHFAAKCAEWSLTKEVVDKFVDETVITN